MRSSRKIRKKSLMQRKPLRKKSLISPRW